MTVGDDRDWWAAVPPPAPQVHFPSGGGPGAEPYILINTPSGPIAVPHSAAPLEAWGQYSGPAPGTVPRPAAPPDPSTGPIRPDGWPYAPDWTTTAKPGHFPPAAQPPTESADTAWDDEWDAFEGGRWGRGQRGDGRRGTPVSSRDRFRVYLTSERESAAMYRELAEVSDGPRGEVLRELADVEDQHAGHWEHQLRALGEPVPSARRHRRSLRLRIVILLARWFSLSAVLPMLEASELASAGRYDDEIAAAPGMRQQERHHARMLATMSVRQAASGGIGANERWHRGDRSGALRAAVFGVNDGLVSNAALVLGFVGSGAPSRAILLAGVAGLLAGAFSMGAGEFVSVSSQREMFAAEIRREEDELRHFPAGEEHELALLYQAKGLPKEQAEETARKIMANPETALDTLAREELGLDPDELGSPWATAAASAASFTVGALVVVLPFLVASGTAAAVTAVLLTAIALAVVGGGLSLLAGDPPRRGATRQLLVGGLAAAAAFGIGGLLGISGA
ncbi:VIT1/CCC1 transporter family protein [Pseudofrankia inefficax]|uniref:Rubrerythrin diiron-binding domain-containing protein n=1 Tax=Pseudofrankia inefficax (strain DSM 45817 / CECT 9037 / DDB 130130 / EuI1c) TaxID=298654 RepID=E3IZ18_PSEI1|nr:VIT1/CCC1 transporter family protein [Pseudofrankia inefficax]ADP80301.1 protein of unknown function DUF125 transmembrane [Pseudofrankia inefficax]